MMKTFNIWSKGLEPFFENVYFEALKIELIKITNDDFDDLRRCLTEQLTESKYESKKYCVSYEPVKRILNDKGLTTFQCNVQQSPNDFINIMSSINNVIEQAQLVDNKLRYNYFIQNCGLNEKDFYSFMGRMASNFHILNELDELFKDTLKGLLKTKTVSTDTNNVELDENAITETLKQLNVKANAIYTIGAFNYNLFSMLYSCQLNDTLVFKISNYLINIINNVKRPNVFSLENINKLMPNLIFPNSYKVRNVLRDVQTDNVRNVRFIT